MDRPPEDKRTLDPLKARWPRCPKCGEELPVERVGFTDEGEEEMDFPSVMQADGDVLAHDHLCPAQPVDRERVVEDVLAAMHKLEWIWKVNDHEKKLLLTALANAPPADAPPIHEHDPVDWHTTGDGIRFCTPAPGGGARVTRGEVFDALDDLGGEHPGCQDSATDSIVELLRAHGVDMAEDTSDE